MTPKLHIHPHIDKAMTKHSFLVAFYAFVAGVYLSLAFNQGGWHWIVFAVLFLVAGAGILVTTGILRDAIESEIK